jgi:hypothetical protein
MTIQELLDLRGPPLVVPEWQRRFSWDRTEVECFWLDLMGLAAHTPGSDSREHNLGLVLLARHNGVQILLDGQNRVALTTILLSVIRDLVVQYRGYEAIRIQQRYIADFDPATGTTGYKLSLNRFDQDFFRREIQDTPPAGRETPKPQIHSHRLIWQARNLLNDRLLRQCGGPCTSRAVLDRALRVETALVEQTRVTVALAEWTDRMRLPVNHPD